VHDRREQPPRKRAEARRPGVCGNPRIALQREKATAASAPLPSSTDLPVRRARAIRKVSVQLGGRGFSLVGGRAAVAALPPQNVPLAPRT
jgi:hypothetical protein